jgi:curved DNA-binding protein CbpA
LLGVDHGASDKELKVAYLKLAKQYHPDVYKGVNKDHFKKVAEAYTTLKNPKKRADYDSQQKIRNQRA